LIFFPSDNDLIELDTYYNGEIPLPQDFLPGDQVIQPTTDANVNVQNANVQNVNNPNMNNSNPNMNNSNNPTVVTENINNNININITTQTDVNRPPSNTVSVGGDGKGLMLTITIPLLTISKTMKILVTDKIEDIIAMLRKKPTIKLDNAAYVIWWIRTGQEPLLLDSQQLVSFYPLKDKDTIQILRPGDKPEDFKMDNFHTNKPDNNPIQNVVKKEKDSLIKNFRKTISIPKIAGKKKKNKEKQ
jgi:hypothetical protein